MIIIIEVKNTKSFPSKEEKKYNELIAKGEIKGEIKKVSPFWSRFEKNKFLFLGIPIIIFFVPIFDIFDPFKFLLRLFFIVWKFLCWVE